MNYDVKITLSGQTEKFRLVQDQSRKLWSLAPPASELKVDYDLNEASFGVGLLRQQVGRPGTQLRISDGYGVDLTEDGLVKHGPGRTSVGNYSGTAITIGTWASRTFLLTTSNLYNYNGSTLNDEGTISSAKNSYAKYGTDLYIAGGDDGGGNGRYYRIQSWGGGITTVTTSSPTSVNFVASVANGTQNRFFVATANTVYSTDDPTGSPTFSLVTTLAEDINNMWSMNGYIFVQTESSIYIIHNDTNGNATAIELNSKMGSRANTTAGTILETEGQEAWSSDGKSLWLLRVLGFNEFDIAEAGPFETTQAVPITSDIRGTIIDVGRDIGAVYVTTLRGSDTYVYKGVEKDRGLWVWSPLINISSTTVSTAKVSAYDGDPYLYEADGTTLYRFKLQDWTVYNTDWQIETSFLNNGEPTVDKIHHSLLTRVDRTGGNIQPASRVTEQSSYTNNGGAVSTDTRVNLGNLTGKEIQLRITMSGNATNQYFNLRGLKVEGVRRPDQPRELNFTVWVDNLGEAAFLRSLNSNSGSIPSFTRSDLDDSVECQVYPGYPREIEGFDDGLRTATRAFEIRALEILN